jgi:hypothetical protein
MEMEEQDWQFIGFMIDGVMQHTLATDNKFAAILLSEPQIVDITEEPNLKSLGVGTTYDEVSQTYVPFKPYDSWVWNTEIKSWEPPVSIPTGVTETTGWAWSEEEVNWVAVPVDAGNAISVTYVE